MFQFSQTTFLFWCYHDKPGNKSTRASKGLIHSHRAFQSIPEPPFSRQHSQHSVNWTTQGALIDSNPGPWAVLSLGPRAVGGVRWGEVRVRVRVGGAASLWHFCTVSRWGKWTLICSMSRVLCAKGTSSLAGTQRLAVSPGPLNKACVILLRATREGKCLLCASSSTVLLAKACLGL